jgi:glycosyltransferase involved in cell wall biosynthesis
VTLRAVDYVIDLRGIQSEAMPERGIPRYLLNLTDALAERGDVDTLTGIVDPRYALPALSPAFGRRGGFGSSDDEPVGLPPPGSRPLIHHIGSPFELQLRRQDLEPWWLRERRSLTVVSLFDVIPAVVPETFPPWARRLWHARAELLRAADAVLCISQYTADDGTRHLDLDPARVVVVGTGVPPALAGEATVPASLPSVRAPFVLYTGGSDHPRKNIPALVRAFARVPATARAGVQLVIATRVTDAVRSELAAEAARAGITEELVLTGFVSDAELAALYRSCLCMVYPSLYEGFGLPIAEAMSHGAAVLASSSTSCGEIQQHPAGRFDPADDADIARVLEAALVSQRVRDELRAYGLERARAFTWEAVAERTLVACRARLPVPARRLRAAVRPRERLFVVPGAPAPFTPQAAFLAIARAVRSNDGATRVVADDVRPSAAGAPLLVSALEATPLCLICDPASARVAAEALSRVPGIAVVWELDAGLAEAGVPHPYLLAALHHARRVVVASRVDAWRIMAIAGRSLAAPPIVAGMPFAVPGGGPPGSGGEPSLAILRPERLGAVGALELARAVQLVRGLGPARVARFTLCACLAAPSADLEAAAAAAGAVLELCHPDAAALARTAGAATVHLDIGGASHSASLFSAALARAAGRPLATVGNAGSAAAVALVAAALEGRTGETEAPGAADTEDAASDPAHVAELLLALAAAIERPPSGAPGVAASLTA